MKTVSLNLLNKNYDDIYQMLKRITCGRLEDYSIREVPAYFKGNFYNLPIEPEFEPIIIQPIPIVTWWNLFKKDFLKLPHRFIQYKPIKLNVDKIPIITIHLKRYSFDQRLIGKIGVSELAKVILFQSVESDGKNERPWE